MPVFQIIHLDSEQIYVEGCFAHSHPSFGEEKHKCISKYFRYVASFLIHFFFTLSRYDAHEYFKPRLYSPLISQDVSSTRAPLSGLEELYEYWIFSFFFLLLTGEYYFFGKRGARTKELHPRANEVWNFQTTVFFFFTISRDLFLLYTYVFRISRRFMNILHASLYFNTDNRTNDCVLGRVAMTNSAGPQAARVRSSSMSRFGQRRWANRVNVFTSSSGRFDSRTDSTTWTR